RRRLELALPISHALSAGALRAACAAIEADLRTSPEVSDERSPHVWISGFGDGLRLKASVWLRQDVVRRDAQRELLLSMRARLEPRPPDERERRALGAEPVTGSAG